LARELGFEKIHQVCEAGIKLGPVRLPVNLKKGNAILTRPGLRLKKYENWKLSGVFGIFGDILTIHFSDATFALVEKKDGACKCARFEEIKGGKRCQLTSGQKSSCYGL
jgi:hypothetical protein